MRWLFGALACLTAVAACSSDANPQSDDQSGDAADQIIRVHRSRTGAGMAAIVSGVVEVDLELGCVWLSDPRGARYPIVWPAGTTEGSDPFEITLDDGQAVHEGDLVEGGGGYVPAATAIEPAFPDDCVQSGDAAVFNSDSDIEVIPDVGIETADTLVGRFSVPKAIGFELVSVMGRSVGISDFVEGTIHVFQTGQFEGPSAAIDGASGAGGFIHVWSDGTIYSYRGSMSTEPLIWEPDPLRRFETAASTLEVVPEPDGERTWLVQDGAGLGPTLVELADLVEVQVARLGSWEIEGSWQPVGVNSEGLVLVSNEGAPRSILFGYDGKEIAEVEGEALSVGWNAVAVRLGDGSLVVTDSTLGSPIPVPTPGPGGWYSAGGPLIPTDAPPIRTGADQLLVAFLDDPERPQISTGDLMILEADGSSQKIYSLEPGEQIASWSRAGDWVVVVSGSNATIIPVDGGDPIDLGEVVPADHSVLSAG